MIEPNVRQTKVITSFAGRTLTSDAASNIDPETVDVVRLVYHPSCLDQLVAFVNNFKSGNSALPVMLDISGWSQGHTAAEMEPRDVEFGDKIEVGDGQGEFPITAFNWGHLFKEDASVYFGFGNVVARVLESKGATATLEIAQGGTIYGGMDIAVPATRSESDLTSVSAKEIRPIMEAGVDYLVVPAQWPRDQIAGFSAELREYLGEDGLPWLIAKVDTGDGSQMLPDIIDAVRGVLVSRRELALTMNPATVPMVTKEIIQMCNDHAKVVVTASEMLASMRQNATPTRAEVSDVANAVIDGADAVVLSEEVGHGKYGKKATELMHKIIIDVEDRDQVRPNWVKLAPKINEEMDAIAYQAYRTAERVDAKAIVCITEAGNTALRLASYRAPVPIIAVTFSKDTESKLSLVRGVEVLRLDTDPSLDDVLPSVSDQLKRESWLKEGDPIIFVSITLSPVGHEYSNLFTVQTLG